MWHASCCLSLDLYVACLLLSKFGLISGMPLAVYVWTYMWHASCCLSLDLYVACLLLSEFGLICGMSLAV